MKSIFLTLALVLTILNGNVRAADATVQMNMHVAGIQIVGPADSTEKNARGAFFAEPGVTVVVAVVPVNGQIVSIEQSESAVTSFTDDKGTDLLAAKSEDRFNKPGMGPVNNEQTNATFQVKAMALPAKGATMLNIVGKLSAKVSASTKQFTTDNVTIQAKTSFDCGDLKLTITSAGVGKSMWGDKEQFTVSFSSAKDLDSIASLEFFDAQGNKLDAHKSSWGGGMGEYFAEYVFKKAVDHAKIVATCWQDMKTVEVPISLKAGLGL